MRALIAGNWKMNGLRESLAEVAAVAAAAPGIAADLLLCLPATLLPLAPRELPLGAQDCHANASGAHTGDLSAEMLADAGASHIIVGHSERRCDHHETDAAVRAKAAAAHRAALTAIICVGETLAQRDANETLAVVTSQLAGSVPDGATPANTAIAYEPVWAIGTGRTPTPDQVAQVHAAIHDALQTRFGATFRILYGGSVKPDNAATLLALPHVHGALVGGASLKAADFLAIARAAPQS
ncbi:triose-phosphate isomerase [Sandaracinobacteroides saxicola]|uniref:Triosephosphate isomerase n=1 Tax=Sandaracinobacteroides saxicola TaxID=2759707 RepID=A0A7G5IJW3_9SPHN|nr:triose-phosphate isomerase [Sandaracinobacteroides saxicola]QMW23655.1 triose-phosphate isomerase [Sandaracinobacteroides saxicola]